MALPGLMTLGCFLIAFSPSMAIWAIIIGQQPLLIALAVVAALFWLVGATAVALLASWALGRRAGSRALLLVLGALVSSGSRLALAKSYRAFEGYVRRKHQQQKGSPLALSDLGATVAAGWGFGTMHAAVMYGSLLAATAGSQATFYVDSCPRVPLVAVAGDPGLSSLRELTSVVVFRARASS